MGTISTITLTRTGNRPLRFQGEEIASTSSRMARGRESNRWHELAVYRSTTHRHFLSVEYRTQWQGELDHAEVFEAANMDEVSEFLQAYDPCSHLIGYRPFLDRPGYDQFVAKQAGIERDITERFRHAVSEVLADLPEEV